MFDTLTGRRAFLDVDLWLLASSKIDPERRSTMKYVHEFRDPVHDFIKVTGHERAIVDSRAVQRLRHVNQLALTNLVYHGTTHKRFEHSLGVMHLAGVAFDELTADQNVSDEVRDLIPELNQPDNFSYWRTVVRMAALCHDLGHLPFSHAAEHAMLPTGYTHERVSSEMIQSDELAGLLGEMTPPVRPEVVAKLAVGPKESTSSFSVWEGILSEIVTGNAFGVDRMDYLLRDSLHAGVEYGKFDHRRLIQSLRLLSPPQGGEAEEELSAPVIGVDVGGIHSAEALLLARYHMFGQLYFHPVRVVYDLHLIDFLRAWLPDGRFSVDVEAHLNMTDNEVWVAMREASMDRDHPGHEPASRIWRRAHFKLLYQATARDEQIVDQPGAVIADWAASEFGPDAVRHRHPKKSGGTVDFPVRLIGGSIESSLVVSETISNLPTNSADLVFVDPELRDRAKKKLTPDAVTRILREAAEGLAEEEDAEAASMELNPTRLETGEEK